MSLIDIKMPDLGTTEAEVKIIEWRVKPGQSVRRGEPLLEVETDKAAMEVEAAASGVLREVFVQPDDRVAAGSVIARMEVKGAAPAAVAGGVESEPAPAEKGRRAEERPARPAGGERRSMFQRKRDAVKEQAAAVESPSLSAVRRTVAQRMLESKRGVPHFYLQTSANAEPMLRRRKDAGSEIVVDAFLVFAAARALARFDEMNFRYERDRLVRQETDNIGVAVDLQGDLFVIGVSAGASAKLEEISSEIKKQYRRLVKGDAEAKKVRPARMTVSNLSACNVESFTAIVNPPESCVLAVGKVAPAVVAVDGEAVVQNRISLTLSVDHRVVSGRYAAEFLGAIVEELEGV